ncbi:MAG: UDP-glucose 4-epimerase GalE [Kiritimatiellae bacterium]|nr:UDP-glucose 4-epimerase GalE [Kiritimatiellia bacterium]
MKVFVTGGAGYIGSVTTELLLNKGHDVVVFDSLERGHRSAIDDRATFEQGNLRDKEAICTVMQQTKPDAVLHFAAYALVGESMEDPGMYYRNNVIGGINLADAMQKAEINKIVFSSTCATYGQPDRVPITEDTLQRPENPYGESKLAFEKALRWYQDIHGIQSVFLRYFNACGATEKFGEDHAPETHLIPLILQVALGQREHISIFGEDYETPDGTCLRDYIHIVDLAQAHILALTGDHSGPFNLGTGTGYSVKEVIDMAREVTGHEIPAVIAPRRPGDPPRLVAGNEKAKTILGWKPKLDDLRKIIESAWQWHQEHPNGYED